MDFQLRNDQVSIGTVLGIRNRIEAEDKVGFSSLRETSPVRLFQREIVLLSLEILISLLIRKQPNEARIFEVLKCFKSLSRNPSGDLWMISAENLPDIVSRLQAHYSDSEEDEQENTSKILTFNLEESISRIPKNQDSGIQNSQTQKTTSSSTKHNGYTVRKPLKTDDSLAYYKRLYSPERRHSLSHKSLQLYSYKVSSEWDWQNQLRSSPSPRSKTLRSKNRSKSDPAGWA
mmetsp:Transcript_4331/g.5020  ORF Transcript_4331/g.5020 Transcript_4331/m.5020 type:complete len:232 (+) Transcript_4331:204-899(+)